MIYKPMIFNQNSVNIFTDASIASINGEVIGCPGFATYIGDIIVNQGYCIDRNSTNNYSELHAIFMGIQEAAKYQNYKYIRIFSDSQTSIYALRDRIFKWVHNVRGGALYGTGSLPIQNQDIIMEIIYYIMDNNIRVEFYHQKGHVNFNDPDKLLRALDTFKHSNSINAPIDLDVIRTISQANDHVDRYTKLMLNQDLYLQDKYNAISFTYIPFNTNEYRGLINPTRSRTQRKRKRERHYG